MKNLQIILIALFVNAILSGNAVPSKGCGRDLRLTKTGSFEFNWSRGRRTVNRYPR